MAYEVWSMIGVLVTAVTLLPLVLSKAFQETIFQLSRWIGSKLFPSNAQCEILNWDLVQDGALHKCGTGTYCSHGMMAHGPKRKECWKHCISTLFKETMREGRRKKWVKKPPELDFRSRYFCVDVRVIVALILCSTKDGRSTTWNAGGSTTYDDDFSIELQERGNTLVAHVRSQIKQTRLNYTKREVSLLMSGYPPFYKEKIVCDHGPSINFPIKKDSDIFRGGWIVAVGLASEQKLKPMALYSLPNIHDDQEDGSYFGRTNGGAFRIAIARLLQVLKNIEEQISDDRSLPLVIKAVQYMVYSDTGSGVERYLPGGRVDGGQLSQLNRRHCEFAMALFNDFYPTDAQIQELRPILAPVLEAAFQGSYRVIQYLKDYGLRLALPPLLRGDWSRRVYLRDCEIDDD